MLQLKGIVDLVLGYNDVSEDNSEEIFLNMGGVLLESEMSKPSGSGATSEIRNQLLKRGRELGGTHFVVLDADEFFCGIEKREIRKLILNLEIGEKLFCNWIMLGSSQGDFCNDFSVWSPKLKDFAFADDPSLNYPTNQFVHFARTPEGGSELVGQKIKFEDFGVLHLQFLNYNLGQVKQCWYRYKEVVDLNRNVTLVNRRYQFTREQFTKQRLSKLPENYLVTLQSLDFSRILEAPIESSWYFHDLRKRIRLNKWWQVHTIDIWFLKDMSDFYQEIFHKDYQTHYILTLRDKYTLRWQHLKFILRTLLNKLQGLRAPLRK
jgi:hypothetical protein